MAALMGVDPQGRYFDELVPPDSLEMWRVPAERALQAGLPYGLATNLATPGREWLRVRYLMMPLRHRLEQPDHLFSMIAWDRTSVPGDGSMLVAAVGEDDLARLVPPLEGSA